MEDCCGCGIKPCPLRIIAPSSEIRTPALTPPALEEEDFPEFSESCALLSFGFPPRTIPFRSASFSQVDVTSEGKYVRNSTKSPITLKPTAFCLNASRLSPYPNDTPQSPETDVPKPLLHKPHRQLSNTQSQGSEFPIVSHTHSKSCPGVMEVTPTPPLHKRPPLVGDGYEAERESLDLDEAETEKIVSFTLGGDDEPISKDDLKRHPMRNESREKGEETKPEEDGPLNCLLMMGPCTGTDSTTSTSGAEEESGDKGHLFRQSSAQSDGSDEQPPLATLSDASCPSPPPGMGTRDSQSISSTLKLGSSAESSSSESGGKASNSAPSSMPTQKEEFGGVEEFKRKELITRAQSINSSLSGTKRGVPSGRFYKRPLRGPYGEMLEAEMNKLIPSRASQEPIDFLRESKSSSPSRGGTDVGQTHDEVIGQPSKLSSMSSLLMASMDDLNLTKQPKYSTNPRCRKISANLPIQGNYAEGSVSIGFHQRTASSPSQLLYTSGTGSANPQTIARTLEGSPRGHVLAEIVETERSYVDSLRILVKKYMEPLKSSDFIDSGLVEEIFFQIPTILWHHERLLDALQKRVVDDMQSVGDVLLDAFRQNSLLECYALFVRNWKNAKGSLKMALASKPSLGRFLEANARQHKGKLNLDSLLIMPIQRIPRYELLVKELLKYTQAIHEDHSRLILVLEKIKRFALHIDCASVDPNDNREVEIEGWGAGLGHLIRQDILPLQLNNARKERALFLFADSLLIASIKRKSTRKPASNPTYSSSWEGCKFKLLLKVPLIELKLVKEDLKGEAKGSWVPEEADDLRTIQRIMDLASSLKCPHVGLDDVLKEMLTATRSTGGEDWLELQFKPTDGSDSPESMKIVFGSLEKKNGWLEAFNDTLAKFVRYGFGKSSQVQFVQALPIRKTRAGLQLSCAAPVSLHNKMSKCDVSDIWVANSDGYVGQVCILTLHPEPSITSCNGVCNSRITSMLAVPPPDHSSQHTHAHSEPPNPLDTPHEEEETQKQRGGGHKEHWSVWLGTEDGGLHVYDCADSVRVKKNRHKIQHKAPLNSIVYFDGRVFVALGNGDVVVYTRNSYGKGWATGDPSWVTIGSAMAPVTKMLCVGREIWCACASAIKVYGDNSGMLELVHSVQVTTEGNQVPRSIAAMVAADDWVWMAIQGTSHIKAYGAHSFEPLHEINVAPNVAKILAGCDDIIRQHKSACLRVTALFVSPTKTLWIGTSAGVILTLSPANSVDSKICALSQGHTGQVRFLTSCLYRDACTVISGGDGYEEFRPLVPSPLANNNSSSFSSIVTSLIGDSAGDPSGREDSTNHLLVWKTPKHA